MVKLTKAQQVALKRISIRHNVSYLDLRRRVQCTFFCDGAVMVEVAGMWIGIEIDGYAHT